jgi:hypothetical protein
MHVVTQPVEHAAELPGGNFRIQLRARGAQRLVQLAGDHRAERIRREIAEMPDRPVDVLQAALGIAAGPQPETLVEAGIPGLRELGDGQRAVEDATLEVVAHHDVHRVGEFVGVHADLPAAHTHQLPVQVLLAPLRAADLHCLLDQRLQVLHERAAAAQVHLEQQRLAFLERETPVMTDRLVAPLLRQAEIVHRMAGLVDRTEQAAEQVVGIEARGDAHVAGNALGERVLALVEPAAVERKTYGLQHLDAELALPRDAELAGERQRCGLRLQRDRLVDQAGELARQGLENRVDVRGRDARREHLDQRIVRCETAGLAEQRRLVAHQMHDLLEVGRKQLEVVGLARLDPEHLGTGRRLREARDQRRRRRDRMIALTAHLAQVRERPVVELRGGRLGALEQPCDLRGRQQCVVFRLQRGELLAAHVRAAARHHHCRVPAQQRQRAAEGVQAAEFLFQLLVWRQAHERAAGGATIAPR